MKIGIQVKALKFLLTFFYLRGVTLLYPSSSPQNHFGTPSKNATMTYCLNEVVILNPILPCQLLSTLLLLSFQTTRLELVGNFHSPVAGTPQSPNRTAISDL